VPNVVEVHVSRLRDKLGDNAWMIETLRGVGYQLRTERGVGIGSSGVAIGIGIGSGSARKKESPP
jgi:hypothetical protein